MKTKHEDIAIEKISVTKMNARHKQAFGKKNEDLGALANSIKRVGIKVSLIGRRNNGKVELVAGERRLNAAKLAGLKVVPMVIHEGIDDAAFLDIMVEENKERVDLTVSEQIVELEHLLKICGKDLKVLAARLGISAVATARRINLTGLSKSWKAALKNPESLANEVEMGYLEVIGLYMEEIQDDVLRSLPNDWGRTPNPFNSETVDEFTKEMKEEYTLHLASASFAVDDESLVKNVGTCVDCMKRSTSKKQADLWEEEVIVDADPSKLGFCLDKACYLDKRNAHGTQEAARVMADHPKAAVVIKDYECNHRADMESYKKQGRSVRCSPEFRMEGVKEGPNTKPLIIDDGHGNLDVMYIKKATPATKKKPATPAAVKEQKATRKDRLKGFRLQLVLADLEKHVAKAPIPKGWRLADLVALATNLGVTIRSEARTGFVNLLKEWQKDKLLGGTKLEELVWMSSRRDVINTFPYDKGATALASEEKGKTVAEFTAFDWDASWTAACVAKPIPKSWNTTAGENSAINSGTKTTPKKKGGTKKK